ncbi:hypothetical protein [Corallibacter sp.]|uniref:hypothetical protein n=1 Tax=Corallibacter sp. TaxID=2038084 RepID=UPI003AB2B0B4
MDEFDIKVLEANGYSFIDGGIVDSLGNYKSKVILNGKVYKSESNYELWYRGQLLERKYSEEPKFNFEKIMSVVNDEEISVVNSNTQKDIKTSVLTIDVNQTANEKVYYKYPLVLVSSLIIYVIIKKLIK